MLQRYCFFILLVTKAFANDIVAVSDSKEGDIKKGTSFNTDDVFVPTSTWNVVKPGQVIPPGLQVRLNLETGAKEARILPEVPGGNQNQGRENMSAAKLKRALKNIKNELKDAAPGKDVRKTFRTYEQLKEELSDMNLKFESSSEVLNGLVSRLGTFINAMTMKEVVNLEAFIAVLGDLEYHLHHGDTAMSFTELGGLALLQDILNHTTSSSAPYKVKSVAAQALGAALHSNPPVQAVALANHLLPLIIKLLSERAYDAKQSGRRHEESRKLFLRRLVYILSGLLRNFPLAQKQFMTRGGIESLSELFDREADSRIKDKIVALLGHVMEEQEFATYVDESERIDFSTALVEQGWCSSLFTMAFAVHGAYGTRDKVLHLTYYLTQRNEECRQRLSYILTPSKIAEIQREYRQEIVENPDVAFYVNDSLRHLVEMSNLLHNDEVLVNEPGDENNIVTEKSESKKPTSLEIEGTMFEKASKSNNDNEILPSESNIPDDLDIHSSDEGNKDQYDEEFKDEKNIDTNKVENNRMQNLREQHRKDMKELMLSLEEKRKQQNELHLAEFKKIGMLHKSREESIILQHEKQMNHLARVHQVEREQLDQRNTEEYRALNREHDLQHKQMELEHNYLIHRLHYDQELKVSRNSASNKDDEAPQEAKIEKDEL